MSPTSQEERQRHRQQGRDQTPPVTLALLPGRKQSCPVTSDLYTLRRRRGTISIFFFFSLMGLKNAPARFSLNYVKMPF